MKFAEPLWLLAGAAACGALLWTWRRYDLRQRAALADFASSHLHAELTKSFSIVKRNWKRGLIFAAVTCLFVALSRPQAGFRWEEVKRRGIEVVFAVDTSKSMMTPDVKPNRLTRAKLAVDDFVSKLNGDGVGLIAFAGNAFLQCPITLDYDAFRESLNALDTNIIPRGGTDIASAIQETQTALQNRAGSDKILVLLTDGEDLEGNALTAAKAAAKDGLKIYTLGVGSTSGELIPVSAENGGGFVKDDAGQFVKSRLDESGLKAIADATGGRYAPLGAQGEGLETIYKEALAPLAKHDLASRQQKIYTERYQWPLAMALGLLLASLLVGTRRRVARKMAAPIALPARPKFVAQGVAVLLAAMVFVPFARAEDTVALAEKAYKKGDFATAQKEYATAAKSEPKQPALEFNAGTAAYKAKQFQQAAEAFQKSLGGEQSADPKRLAAQEDAFYNLGNTLYRDGQATEHSDPKKTIPKWEEAVKTYEGALQLRATDADAKYNLDLVKRKLEELKKQEQQKKDQEKKDQDKKDQDKKDQQKKDQSGKDQDKKDEQKKDQSGKDQDKKDEQKKDQTGKDQDKKDEQKKDQSGKDQDKKDEQKKDQAGKDQDKKDEQKKDQAEKDQAKADQQKADAAQAAADAQHEPGKMSKEEARALLDSVKNDERRLPATPVGRSGINDKKPERPIKDW